MALNPEFMDKWGDDSKKVLFYGQDIDNLTQNELIAVIRCMADAAERERNYHRLATLADSRQW